MVPGYILIKDKSIEMMAALPNFYSLHKYGKFKGPKLYPLFDLYFLS